MQTITDLTDPRIAKAYAHPLRIQILGMLDNRTASPSEIAKEFDAPLTHVSYHVRQLAALGLLKLVRTTPRRGAVEHHYTADVKFKVDADAWGRAPEAVKRTTVAGFLGTLGDVVTDATREGGFERKGVQILRTVLRLDKRAWERVSKEIEKTNERLLKIAAESKQRHPGEDDPEVSEATVALLLFETTAKAGLPKDSGINRHKKRRAK